MEMRETVTCMHEWDCMSWIAGTNTVYETMRVFYYQYSMV